MGTELEHAINPLGGVSKESNIRFGVNEWSYKHPITLNKLENPMERFLNRQNAESIRKTMQAQEEIFKHQVRELHRLYSVQKMLMDEMKKETRQKRHWTNQPNLTSRSLVFGFNDNNSSRERSESCSADTTALRTTTAGINVLDLDLERPADHGETSAVDLDNRRLYDKMRRDGSDVEDSELELTLSIGLSSSSSKSYQREINRELDSSASFKSDNNNNNNNNSSNNQDFSGPSTPISGSSTTLDQEKKRPHWLFQGLSINKT